MIADDFRESIARKARILDLHVSRAPDERFEHTDGRIHVGRTWKHHLTRISFCTDDKTPSINVELDWRYNPQFNGDFIRNVFVRSLAYREQFRLFSNGTNEGIPIQYRFPPKYKLIEMQFRRAKSHKRQRNPYGMGSGIGATVPFPFGVALGMRSDTGALFLLL
jgi:hypothetical protein